jgi:queuine tRNA-ribosyltransferase
MALVPEPDERWRVNLVASRWQRSREPILEGCPCPACTAGYGRGYLRHLLKQGELTGMRLLTLHNLAFISQLMEDLRAALAANTFREVTAALRDGAAPGSAAQLA